MDASRATRATNAPIVTPLDPARERMIEFLVESRGELADADFDAGDAQDASGLRSRLLRRMTKTRQLPVAPQARYWSLPDNALRQLFNREMHRRIESARADAATADRMAGASGATADPQARARAPWWSIDEAVAMLLGRSPEGLTWTRLEPLAGESGFAQWFGIVRRLALNADPAWRREHRVKPAEFIAWAKTNEFPVPDALSVLQQEGEQADPAWQSRLADAEGEAARLRQELETLREHLARLDEAAGLRVKLLAKEAAKARAALLEKFDAERTSWATRIAELQSAIGRGDGPQPDTREMAVANGERESANGPLADPKFHNDRLLH